MPLIRSLKSPATITLPQDDEPLATKEIERDNLRPALTATISLSSNERSVFATAEQLNSDSPTEFQVLDF